MNFGFDIYDARRTPVHRCDARVKILLLVAFSVSVLLVPGWLPLVVLAALLVAVLALARIPAGSLLRAAAPVLVLAAFSFAVAALSTRTPEGVIAGALVALRMVVLVGGSFAVCFTTTATDLLSALRSLMHPLRVLRVPVDDIATVLALAIRFIPVLGEEFGRIRTAQMARGGGAGGSLMHALRLWGSAFTALFVGMFRRADRVARAMNARCYGAGETRTRLR